MDEHDILALAIICALAAWFVTPHAAWLTVTGL